MNTFIHNISEYAVDDVEAVITQYGNTLQMANPDFCSKQVLEEFNMLKRVLYARYVKIVFNLHYKLSSLED